MASVALDGNRLRTAGGLTRPGTWLVNTYVDLTVTGFATS